MQKYTQKKTAGYTLIEVLVAIGVFILLASISIPYLGDFYRNQNVGAHCKKVRQAIYRAEYRSIAGEHGTPWGVLISPSGYTLFAGKSYAARNAYFDETETLPSSMTFTGLSSVVFDKYSGLPNTYGTVSISQNATITPCVAVSADGLVD